MTMPKVSLQQQQQRTVSKCPYEVSKTIYMYSKVNWEVFL